MNIVEVPETSHGKDGDLKGMMAVDDGYFYICTANYDGGKNIWQRFAFTNESFPAPAGWFDDSTYPD